MNQLISGDLRMIKFTGFRSSLYKKANILPVNYYNNKPISTLKFSENKHHNL